MGRQMGDEAGLTIGRVLDQRVKGRQGIELVH